MVESRYKGHILDLSTHGAYLQFGGPFHIAFGQRLEIEFEANGLQFRVMACVRMVEPYCGVGVEFTDISSRGRRQLQEVIEELKEQQRQDQDALEEAQQRADRIAVRGMDPPSLAMTAKPGGPASRS
jgi:c-di-GMP-binding flagellar brake protein YcgR